MFLQIHEGDFNTPATATLCGIRIIDPYFSTGNKLSLHARSFDQSHSYTGSYDISYTTTDQGKFLSTYYFCIHIEKALFA